MVSVGFFFFRLLFFFLFKKFLWLAVPDREARSCPVYLQLGHLQLISRWIPSWTRFRWPPNRPGSLLIGHPVRRRPGRRIWRRRPRSHFHWPASLPATIPRRCRADGRGGRPQRVPRTFLFDPASTTFTGSYRFLLVLCLFLSFFIASCWTYF